MWGYADKVVALKKILCINNLDLADLGFLSPDWYFKKIRIVENGIIGRKNGRKC